MKAKTIKAILNKKVTRWIDTIKDEELQKDVRKGTIITGGSITSLLLNEEVNDYDVYFTSQNLAYRVAVYYVEQYRQLGNNTRNFQVQKTDNGNVKVMITSVGVSGDNPEDTDNELDQYLGKITDSEPDALENAKEESPDYRPVFFSANAITLSDDMQIILRFVGEPDDIHESFDFVHAKCYYRTETGHLSLPREALEAILTKELVYRGSKYPLCSIFRAKKFVERGWTINAGQYLKMAMQLNELDLADVGTLEDQLTGVDTYYFQMLIRIIQERKNNEETFEVTADYVTEVVDRIF